jgi:hypothetical protein
VTRDNQLPRTTPRANPGGYPRKPLVFHCLHEREGGSGVGDLADDWVYGSGRVAVSELIGRSCGERKRHGNDLRSVIVAYVVDVSRSSVGW